MVAFPDAENSALKGNFVKKRALLGGSLKKFINARKDDDMALREFSMGLLKTAAESLEAASGGILLHLFEKYMGHAKPEEIKEFYEKFVKRGILPFGLSKEDEARLIARFRKVEGGLKPEEALVVTSFLANKCTSAERTSFRYSIAAIEEIPRVVKTIYEDKARQKTRTVEKPIVIDPGLDFLKMLADKSFDDEKRYTMCKGLGLFDFPHNIQKAWDQFASGFRKVDETLLTLAFKIRNSLLPAPQPGFLNRLNPKNLF